MRGLSWLAAPLGRLRVRAGARRLQDFIDRNRGLAPDALRDATWAEVKALGEYFAGAERHRNKRAYGWREIMFERMLILLDRAGLGSPPDVITHGREILRQAAEDGPTVVLTLHSPVDAVLNRLFDEAGIPWVLLATRAEKIIPRARLLGLRGPLEVVGRDDDSLLTLRRHLREGRAVCACVDFVWPKHLARRRVFVGPALFEFGIRTGCAIVYADTRVTDDGRIDVAYTLPRVAANASADAHAEDFIAWLKLERGETRLLAVRKWRARSRRWRGIA
jgi:hypothetical protein